MTRATGRGFALTMLLIAVGAACTTPSPSPPSSATTPARHIVFVTIDTLRADRLGAYGNTTVATPHLDRLAREGAIALQASAHVPLTRPSHLSMFTGLHPDEHGIRDNVAPPLSDRVPLLAEILSQQGFTTAAFVSSIVLSRQSGLQRGFAHYSDQFEVGEDDARFLNTIQKRGDVVMAEAVDWLRSAGASRRFAWIHLYDPHDPYEPPEPYASRYADRPYDGEVAWSDELVGRLETALAETGMRDDTLLVVTSDHGEGLDEHQEAVHGFFVYETTLRVPFLARGPGIVPGTRLNVTARSVDIMPTVLDLLGLASHIPPVSGRSLAAGLAGAAMDDEPVFAESLVPLVHYGWSDLRALRDGSWKYILAPRPELYNLEQDPGELHNLVDTQPARARALRAGLEQRLRREQAAARQSSAPTASVPPDLLEKLGALGYVSAARGGQTLASGADPKDKIEEYQAVNTLMRQGLIALREGRYHDSLGEFERLFARGIDSFESHYYAARALTGLQQWTRAAEHYERALTNLPAYTAAYVGLADAHLAAGQPSRALEAVRRGLAVAPDDPRLIERHGDVGRRLGDGALAVRSYERVAQLAPRDALVRVKLGELYRDMGQPAAAVRLLQEAVALDPQPSYWNSLGMVLGGNGDAPAAEQAFRAAVAGDANHPQYAYNLGLILARQNKRGEAAAQFRRALALDPRFTAARQRLAELR